MRIPHWSAEALPQPDELVTSIRTRRPNGELLNLDHALPWSAPLARRWSAT